MNKPKITFLMTAHNAERFIDKSIESVLNQSEPEVMLIIRNNGSTDRTDEICKSYAKADNRIQYLENKVNWCTDEGAAYYERAWWPELDTEYVSILDHDDCLHEDFAKIMYNAGRKYQSQIIACGRVYFNDKTMEEVGRIVPPQINTKNTKTLDDNFRKLYTPVCRAVWGKLYRLDFYEKYYAEVRRFPKELKLSTDTYTVLGYLGRCSTFTSVASALYYYRSGIKSGFFNL